MPKQLALWEVPLRKDWDLIAKCSTAIPIVEKTSRKVVLLSVDRSDQMLKHCRTITSNHNAHVRAQRKRDVKTAIRT